MSVLDFSAQRQRDSLLDTDVSFDPVTERDDELVQDVLADAAQRIGLFTPDMLEALLVDLDMDEGLADELRMRLEEMSTHYDPDRHPRWPANTPGGLGGQFMRVGQRFSLKGVEYDVAAVFPDHIFANVATKGVQSAPQTIEIKADAIVDVGGKKHPTIKGVTRPEAESIKGTGSNSAKTTSAAHFTGTVVDPYVNPATHDPSIPIPEGSKVTPEQWKRFGKVDQERYSQVMELFGQWSPGAAQGLVNAILAKADPTAKAILKEQHQSQLGSSSGLTLSMHTVFGAVLGLIKGHPSVEQARTQFEAARALQDDVAAALQWDLYNRAKAPDIALFHRNSTDSFFKNDVIKGNTPVFAGLSQSQLWSPTHNTGFGSNTFGTPMAIRHIVMSRDSANISGSGYQGELEVATADAYNADERSVEYTPGELSSMQQKWLQKVTKDGASGDIIATLKASAADMGASLPVPAADPVVQMDGQGGVKYVTPPKEACVNVGTLGYSDVDANGNPVAKPAKDLALKPGDYVEGMQGTRYLIVADPSYALGFSYFKVTDTGSPVPGTETTSPETGQTTTKFVGHHDWTGATECYQFEGNGAKAFKKLAGHYELPTQSSEFKSDFHPDAWAFSAKDEAKLLGKFNTDEMFHLEGTFYKVLDQLGGGQTRIQNLTTGKLGKINSDYKSTFLVLKPGYSPTGQVELDPDDFFTGEPTTIGAGFDSLTPGAVMKVGMTLWKVESQTPDGHIVASQASGSKIGKEHTFDATQMYAPMIEKPFGWEPPAVGDTLAIDGKKATVTKLLKNGDVQVNLAPGVMKLKPSDPLLGTLFSPDKHTLGDKMKLKQMAAGSLFHASAGVKTIRPYMVVEQLGAKTSVKNLDTGEISTLSANKSFTTLIPKMDPAAVKQPELGLGMTPGPDNLTDVYDPALWEAGPEKNVADWQPGDMLMASGKPLKVMAVQGEAVTLKDLTTGEVTKSPIGKLQDFTLPTLQAKGLGSTGATPSSGVQPGEPVLPSQLQAGDTIAVGGGNSLAFKYVIDSVTPTEGGATLKLHGVTENDGESYTQPWTDAEILDDAGKSKWTLVSKASDAPAAPAPANLVPAGDLQVGDIYVNAEGPWFVTKKWTTGKIKALSIMPGSTGTAEVGKKFDVNKQPLSLADFTQGGLVKGNALKAGDLVLAPNGQTIWKITKDAAGNGPGEGPNGVMIVSGDSITVPTGEELTGLSPEASFTRLTYIPPGGVPSGGEGFDLAGWEPGTSVKFTAAQLALEPKVGMVVQVPNGTVFKVLGSKVAEDQNVKSLSVQQIHPVHGKLPPPITLSPQAELTILTPKPPMPLASMSEDADDWKVAATMKLHDVPAGSFVKIKQTQGGDVVYQVLGHSQQSATQKYADLVVVATKGIVTWHVGDTLDSSDAMIDVQIVMPPTVSPQAGVPTWATAFDASNYDSEPANSSLGLYLTDTIFKDNHGQVFQVQTVDAAAAAVWATDLATGKTSVFGTKYKPTAILSPKASVSMDNALPGSPVQLGHLQVGDRFLTSDGEAQVVATALDSEDQVTVAPVLPDGSLGNPSKAGNFPMMVVTFKAHAADSLPPMPTTDELNPDDPNLEILGDWDGDGGYVTYLHPKSGKKHYPKIMDMPVGTVFKDKEGKKFVVKLSASGTSIISDGEKNWGVNGQWRGFVLEGETMPDVAPSSSATHDEAVAKVVAPKTTPTAAALGHLPVGVGDWVRHDDVLLKCISTNDVAGKPLQWKFWNPETGATETHGLTWQPDGYWSASETLKAASVTVQPENVANLIPNDAGVALKDLEVGDHFGAGSGNVWEITSKTPAVVQTMLVKVGQHEDGDVGETKTWTTMNGVPSFVEAKYAETTKPQSGSVFASFIGHPTSLDDYVATGETALLKDMKPGTIFKGVTLPVQLMGVTQVEDDGTVWLKNITAGTEPMAIPAHIAADASGAKLEILKPNVTGKPDPATLEGFVKNADATPLGGFEPGTLFTATLAQPGQKNSVWKIISKTDGLVETEIVHSSAAKWQTDSPVTTMSPSYIPAYTAGGPPPAKPAGDLAALEGFTANEVGLQAGMLSEGDQWSDGPGQTVYEVVESSKDGMGNVKTKVVWPPQYATEGTSASASPGFVPGYVLLKGDKLEGYKKLEGPSANPDDYSEGEMMDLGKLAPGEFFKSMAGTIFQVVENTTGAPTGVSSSGTPSNTITVKNVKTGKVLPNMLPSMPATLMVPNAEKSTQDGIDALTDTDIVDEPAKQPFADMPVGTLFKSSGPDGEPAGPMLIKTGPSQFANKMTGDIDSMPDFGSGHEYHVMLNGDSPTTSTLASGDVVTFTQPMSNQARIGEVVHVYPDGTVKVSVGEKMFIANPGDAVKQGGASPSPKSLAGLDAQVGDTVFANESQEKVSLIMDESKVKPGDIVSIGEEGAAQWKVQSKDGGLWHLTLVKKKTSGGTLTSKLGTSHVVSSLKGWALHVAADADEGPLDKEKLMHELGPGEVFFTTMGQGFPQGTYKTLPKGVDVLMAEKKTDEPPPHIPESEIVWAQNLTDGKLYWFGSTLPVQAMGNNVTEPQGSVLAAMTLHPLIGYMHPKSGKKKFPKIGTLTPGTEFKDKAHNSYVLHGPAHTGYVEVEKLDAGVTYIVPADLRVYPDA